MKNAWWRIGDVFVLIILTALWTGRLAFADPDTGASVGAEPARIPALESGPISTTCPITGQPVGHVAPTATLWGYAVGFASESARDAFLGSPVSDREAFVLGFLEPVNTECPIDGTPVAQCKARTLYEGFAVACCDARCVSEFNRWEPGRVGAFLRLTVEPINTAVCPQTGDALVPNDPYYVAHEGRLLQLCCDYCLMEWQYQPVTREGSLMRALGMGSGTEQIARP